MNEVLITNLKNKLYEANRLVGEASAHADRIERELAEAIAASMGLSVGSVVVERKSIGCGSRRRTQERRYRIVSFRYKSYGSIPLVVFGRTIRKDGTDGERHEIYGEWEIETPTTADAQTKGVI